MIVGRQGPGRTMTAVGPPSGTPRQWMMKVLVIGKGGREHALVWKLSQSPRAERVYCAPGNAGTARHGDNVPLEVNDIDKLVRFAAKEGIGLTVVGPEEPLALGIVDA